MTLVDDLGRIIGEASAHEHIDHDSRGRRARVVCWRSRAALPVLAHHSFAAEFDDTQPLKLTGTITKVEWSNPHIWYYVDVKNPDGTVTNWALSAGRPAS